LKNQRKKRGKKCEERKKKVRNRQNNERIEKGDEKAVQWQ